MKHEAIRKYLTNYSLALIFIVFGIWELVNPVYWSGFVPALISNFLGNIMIVRVHGLVLAAIGVALAVGYKIKLASAIGTLVMLGIVISLYIEAGFTTILVRDFVIMCFTASIFFDNYREKLL